MNPTKRIMAQPDIVGTWFGGGGGFGCCATITDTVLRMLNGSSCCGLSCSDPDRVACAVGLMIPGLTLMRHWNVPTVKLAVGTARVGMVGNVTTGVEFGFPLASGQNPLITLLMVLQLGVLPFAAVTV